MDVAARPAYWPILAAAGFSAYRQGMTALFDHAVEAARSLPSSTQDDVARLLLQLAREEQPVEISDLEMATFGPSLAQADRGELATDDQVRAVWAKHGL